MLYGILYNIICNSKYPIHRFLSFHETPNNQVPYAVCTPRRHGGGQQFTVRVGPSLGIVFHVEGFFVVQWVTVFAEGLAGTLCPLLLQKSSVQLGD